MGLTWLLFHCLRVSCVFLISVRQLVQELNNAHVQKVIPLLAPIVAKVIQYDMPTEPFDKRVNV